MILKSSKPLEAKLCERKWGISLYALCSLQWGDTLFVDESESEWMELKFIYSEKATNFAKSSQNI